MAAPAEKVTFFEPWLLAIRDRLIQRNEASPSATQLRLMFKLFKFGELVPRDSPAGISWSASLDSRIDHVLDNLSSLAPTEAADTLRSVLQSHGCVPGIVVPESMADLPDAELMNRLRSLARLAWFEALRLNPSAAAAWRARVEAEQLAQWSSVSKKVGRDLTGASTGVEMDWSVGAALLWNAVAPATSTDLPK